MGYDAEHNIMDVWQARAEGAYEASAGRVPGTGPGTGAPVPFPFDGEIGDGPTATGITLRESVAHTVLPNSLADLFLSQANVDALQQGIRYRVWVETEGRSIIGRQSDVELGLVMRSLLLDDGHNVEVGDTGMLMSEVRALNASVLDFCVPRIVAELGIYMRYRKDISSLPVPLERAQLATTRVSAASGWTGSDANPREGEILITPPLYVQLHVKTGNEPEKTPPRSRLQASAPPLPGRSGGGSA